MEDRVINMARVGVLAMLLDGDATRKEIDTFSYELSHKCGVSNHELEDSIGNIIDTYRAEGVAGNFNRSISLARELVSSLSDRSDKSIAVFTAINVLQINITPDKLKFMSSLSSLLKS